MEEMSFTTGIVIIVIASFLFCLIPIAIFFFWGLYAQKKAKEREKFRAEILRNNKEIAEKCEHFPIDYSSERKAKKFCKMFPIEGTGILFIDSGEAIFIGKKPSGENIEIEFAKENSSVDWFGVKMFNLGWLPWFTIQRGDEKYYFTSATAAVSVAAFVSGVEESVREIYEKVKEQFK